MTSGASPARGNAWLCATVASVVLITACTTRTVAPTAVPSAKPSTAPWPSPLTLSRIQDEIMRRASGRFSSIGIGAATVFVTLLPSEATLAQELVDAYGPAVEVSVGLFPFPLRDNGMRSCAIGRTFGDLPSLKVTLDPPIPAVITGQAFQVTVRILNRSSQPLDLQTGTEFEVYLFRPGSTTPIGDGGGTHLVGRDLHLLPANATTLPGNGGTASCDASLGFAIPPGTYEARALIDVSFQNGASPFTFWSDPSRVAVVAR